MDSSFVSMLYLRLQWQAQSHPFLYFTILPFLFSIVPLQSMWTESGRDLDKI